MSRIKIKLMGTFRWVSGIEQSEIEIQEPMDVRKVLEYISAKIDGLKSIVDKNSILKLRPSMIILVNEVEIGLLKGLESPLNEGDVLTIIPTAHGG